MVIELSGVQFGLKSSAWFPNGTSAQREFDLKSQVWFQTKLHSTQFNYHFITPILKSHSSFVKIDIYLSTSGNPVFKKAEPETLP